MGLGDSAYWLGNLLHDYLAYLLVIGVYFLLLSIYEVTFIRPFLPLMTSIYLCFGVALLSYAYMMSLLFSSANQVYKLLPIINYFFLFLLSAILDMVLSKTYPDMHAFSQVFFMLISPFYLMSQAIKHMPQTIGMVDQSPLEALMGEQTGQTGDTMLVQDSWVYCLLMLL